jgi:hypothetical protein
MIAAALTLAAALTFTPAVPTDRTVDPSRGGVGRYLDSNVAAVWDGATHAERAVWLCIRRHESLHAGHYTARNGQGSSASGAGQWIRATWAGLAPWVRVNGRPVARQYPEAYLAPAWVQDAAYRHVYARNGLHMWRGTGCPGT